MEAFGIKKTSFLGFAPTVLRFFFWQIDTEAHICKCMMILENLSKIEDNGMSYADFPKSNTIFVFNLTSNLSDGTHFDLVSRISPQLEVRFRQNLEEAVTCLVHAKYDSVITIDKDRNVSPDYIV